MDLSRSQSLGRLSEGIGKDTIDREKFFRTFSLRRAAEVSYNVYFEKAKQEKITDKIYHFRVRA
jgi:penicillin amidase